MPGWRFAVYLKEINTLIKRRIKAAEKREKTYSSAKHSIKMVEEAFWLVLALIVEEDDAVLSNSARTATMTAAMS